MSSDKSHFQDAPTNLNGEWICYLSRFGEEYTAVRLNLTMDGANLSGSFNELRLTGTIIDSSVNVSVTTPAGNEWGELQGIVEGDIIRGKVKRPGGLSQWRARRTQTVHGEPRVHMFEPVSFPRVFSGNIVPVLHINPGDTVKTSTLDAGGWDEKGVEQSRGGNPQTGPFFVEGAMPGDTLVIKVQRLFLNRNAAVGGRHIMADSLQPFYYRGTKLEANAISEWILDLEKSTGRLAHPTKRLMNYTVNLRPILGCVAVAPPANQSFRSVWLGPWGGNLDYNRLCEGVTVFLPVFQEGALLFIGDGHALQGDGEINGNALETSMHVEILVDLIRGKNTLAPRFEDDQHLMASGIAGSLKEALQQATTELASWLERDYNLSSDESNIVLGNSIHYDIAVVVNPQMHVVARISKKVLATLGK